MGDAAYTLRQHSQAQGEFQSERVVRCETIGGGAYNERVECIGNDFVLDLSLPPSSRPPPPSPPVLEPIASSLGSPIVQSLPPFIPSQPIPSTSRGLSPSNPPLLLSEDASSELDEIDLECENIRRNARENAARRLANESAEARATRLAHRRAQHRERVANRGSEEISMQRRRDRQNTASSRANMTAERSVRVRENAVRRRRARSHVLESAAFSYDPETNYLSILNNVFKDMGTMHIICKFCDALKFKGEAKGMCCSSGKVRIARIEPPPSPYINLFLGDSVDLAVSKAFLKHITRYNDIFKMTSFGARGGIETFGWMPTFRVQGQIYHRMGSLLPVDSSPPQYLQVYFMGDSDVQIDHRTGMFNGLKRNIVALLQELFMQHNVLIHEFRTALDRMPTDAHRAVIRADLTPAGEHERRYNAPVTEEVAIIVVDSGHYQREIVVQKRDSRTRIISEMNPLYDALQYPILFWRGNGTYDHETCKQVDPTTGDPTRKRVSPMEYYSYLMQVRRNDPNFLFMCGRLMSQIAVDWWAKVEAQRLKWHRYHQDELRKSEYVNLRDNIQSDGNPVDIGQRVILPSSFIGSPRHMHEYAQDAMAYTRLCGRPDLFITFTCNKDWPEIQQNLLDNQVPADRHDIVARVFRQKLSILMDVLTKQGIFGPSRCHMYSIEWQKRGLPHAHILLWLQDHISPGEIDDVISAELPSPSTDRELYDIVLKCLRHGPCGVFNLDAPCNDRHHKCTKKYPWRFTAETHTEKNGYPIYRRRSPADGGQSVDINGFTVDNRWIVPHSPILCRMFNAHINVEYCNSVRSIKYVCKYINKGSDMAILQIANVDEHDEIAQYHTGRYLSSGEGAWRLLGFPIHARYPPVEHLAVHMEGEQIVCWTSKTAPHIVDHPLDTTLTAFFKLCQTDPFARSLLYSDVPTHYTWTECVGADGIKVRSWSRRRSGFAVARMYTVHPKRGDVFFLRILLTRVPGPTSFVDLKTFEGRVCETYREVCQLRGFLESDSQWKDTLREAAATRSGKCLRELFAVILVSCSPSDPMKLWDEFRDHLSEDILMQQQRMNRDITLDYSMPIYNQALILIEDACLSMDNRTLDELGLPSPDRSHIDPMNTEIVRETSYDRERLQDYFSRNISLLVPDQQAAFDAIRGAIDNDSGGVFFLDAPGGTGKTFLINLLLAYVRQKGEIILAVASSGIAATLLEGGRTAHSAFKLPLSMQADEPMCSISRGSAKAMMLQRCKAIIWDECTMSHRKAFEAVDRLLKDIRRRPESLMGGVVVMLSGDCRQTLPVVKRGTPADEVRACIKASTIWGSIQKMSLSTNMRVHRGGDPAAGDFAQKLLDIGNGVYRTEADSDLIRLDSLCRPVQSLEELIDRVFPDIRENVSNLDWLHERAILAPLNETVGDLNIIIQDRLESLARTYFSFDRTVDTDDAVNYSTEFLNSIEVPGVPPHKLTLKIGSPIMLMRNINPPKLCNGTRLIVKEMRNNYISATILTGAFRGEDTFIPRIPIVPDDLVVNFKRLQFPIRLAYAMTINKSQGQTLKTVGLDLQRPCFSHGQLYVACSRVGSSSNLFVLAPGGATKNIVYKAALEN